MTEPSSAARGGYWLETQSAEYDLVKYHVVMASERIGVVEKLSVWKIVNPELQYRFERRSSGMLRLQSWYDAELCVGPNTLESICSQGFQPVPQQSGLVVPVGIIMNEGEALSQRECCYVLLDVAVGRSYVYDGNVRDVPVPSGYDSLYLPAQPLDRNKDGKFSLQEYQSAANFDFRSSSGYSHRYFIGDLNQVCPKYVVRFQIQKARPGRIPDLEIEDAQFVDPITLQPTERSNAATNSGAFDRRFVSIDVAYAQALEDMSKIHTDPTAAAKAQWIRRQLNTLEDKVRDINVNYAEVSEVIQEAAVQAQRRLQEMVRQKLELCLSMEIELRRQTEQIEWLDGILSNEMQRVQSALNDAPTPAIRRKLMLRFLKLWKQHSLHRNALSRAKPHELQALSSLQPDLRVQPDIKIFIDPFYAPSSPTALRQAAVEDHEVDEHAEMIDQYSQRASENNYFNTAVQSSHPFLSPAVRAVIDQEIGSIQQALSVASKQGGLQLPSSIAGYAVGGSGGIHQPLLSMHAVLGMLRAMPPPVPSQGEAANGQHPPLETEDQLLQAFVDSVAATTLSPLSSALLASTAVGASSPQPVPAQEAAHLPPPPPSVAGDPTASPASSVAASRLESPPVEAPVSATPAAAPPAPASVSGSVAPQSPTPSQVVPPASPFDNLRFAQGQAPPSSENSYAEVDMTIPQLKQVILPFRTLYMSDLGAKKLRQLQIRLHAGVEDQGHRALDASRILAHNNNEMQSLYYCLPVFSKTPVLKLIYSTSQNVRSLEELYSRTMKYRNPTVLLIRSGGFRFGAYLSHSPLPTCSWMGSPACFLFSLTLNMKIPYTARQVPQDSKLQEPMAIFGQDDRLFIGNGDLTIDSELRSGTSEVENCYGLGLEPQSVEAMCLLAGSPVFVIDEVEVWTVIS